MSILATVEISDVPSIPVTEKAEVTTYQNFGRTTLAELFDDWVIYRNLEPLEPTLPGLKSAYRQMQLPKNGVPRKVEADYAKAAIWFMKEAQRIREVECPLTEIAFIGDSIYSDKQAFQHIQQASGWTGACFIGKERREEELTIQIDASSKVYQANRWAALANWASWALEQGLFLDQSTAVIVDMDKSALGALGRNDHTLNQARLEAIYHTMDAVLGQSSNHDLFEQHYNELDQPKYHGLTSDNQDYLAYICLVTNAGLIQIDEIVEDVAQGNLDSFEQFIRWVDSRMMTHSDTAIRLQETHQSVIGSVRAGDPTPFKRFRRQEFMTTLKRMNSLPDDSSAEALLANEITITQEVREIVLWLKERGCLLLCLSDKPSEASCPDGRMLTDLLPVHRAESHSVGTTIQHLLDQIEPLS